MADLIDREVVQVPDPPLLHVGPPRLGRDLRGGLAADQVRRFVEHVDDRGLKQGPADAPPRAALAGATFGGLATSLTGGIPLDRRLGGRRQPIDRLPEPRHRSLVIEPLLRCGSRAQGDHATDEGQARERDRTIRHESLEDAEGMIQQPVQLSCSTQSAGSGPVPPPLFRVTRDMSCLQSRLAPTGWKL